MDKQPIGEFIATLRKDAGYTQQDVADRLNISDRTLSSWETDRTEPDLSSLTALAKLYGVTADEILRGKRNDAPDLCDAETEQSNPVKERFDGYLSALKTLTALGALCAAVVLASCIIILYSPAPLWVGVALMVAGAVCNGVCVSFIFRKTNGALSTVADGEKGVALTIKHKASLAVIINSLAYIAWVIVILMCYWFVGYYDMNPTGTVHEYYDLYSASMVIICFVLGGSLLLFGITLNLTHINCLGNERQKSAVKANVKLIKIISVCGAAFITLCLIPYAVICHYNFTETRDYFTANGVDEVYKKFQTYSLDYDMVKGEIDDDFNTHVTIIPKGEYYLDFQNETYVEATSIHYEIFPQTVHFFDLGNNFYARHGIIDLKELSSVGVYYLKDGVNIEDISLEKDYEEYFIYLSSYEVVKFTSPENEPLFAVCIPYFFKRNEGHYDDEGWRYDYDAYYNIRDELILTRNGDEYTYSLITYRNYSPLATLVYLDTVCVTACACVAAQLVKRKKITYCF